jgi:CheY-like chemotaxis protein
MNETTMRQLLFVDDDRLVCEDVEAFLNDRTVSDSGDRLQVQTLTDFDQALKELEKRRYDLIVLDIKLDLDGASRDDEGITVLKKIQERRFLPVIFYTGVANVDQNLESPLVRVVRKSEGTQRLLEVVKEVFLTGLPTVNLALIHHMEVVQRDYMWNFVAEHWEEINGKGSETDLAYLLARRFALSLSETGIQQLSKSLGGESNGQVAEGKVHPMRYYVMPPVEPSPLAGDIYRGEVAGKAGYWVLLTPSCDMVAGREKAEQVLLASGELLVDQAEYKKWQAKLPNPSKSSVREFSALLSDNRRRQPERYYCLPGALSLPDLIVDFQKMVMIPRQELAHLERISSLDSPFAEALLARLARYFGRLGTPDLDIGAVMNKLQIPRPSGQASSRAH